MNRSALLEVVGMAADNIGPARTWYLLSQAITTAIGTMEEVPPPHREVSNIEQLKWLEERCFPIFRIAHHAIEKHRNTLSNERYFDLKETAETVVTESAAAVMQAGVDGMIHAATAPDPETVERVVKKALECPSCSAAMIQGAERCPECGRVFDADSEVSNA